jgi:threonylcarbamoyladenosine tRNA methylthiotransferase MtaB
VNQLETEALAEAFKTAGFRLVPWESKEMAILLINTCTVTSKAEQKARRLIRWALKNCPETAVVVTGCYAQMDPDGIAGLDPSAERLFVLAGDRKSALLDLPGFLARETGEALPKVLSRWFAESSADPIREAFRFAPGDFSFHSRGFLKIQDGCDNRCAYCRVPFARGSSVSLEADRVLASLRELEARGCGEAVLTGVHIGQYRDGPLDFAGLLGYLLAETREIRLRLSSIDPESFTSALPLSNPRIRPHFHLSVQSGSERVLERMGRRYTPDRVREAVRFARSVKADPFLACDIITGFPGETSNDFEATYQLCADLDFAWIHGFPYSPRPGTAAYSFNDRASEREAGLRADRLIALGTERRRRYVRRWIGRGVEAVAESAPALPASQGAAISENYLKLLFIQSGAVPPKPGSLVRCRLLDGTPSDAHFDAVAEPE